MKSTIAIAGLGSRGLHTYAQYTKQFPHKMEIAAVADTNPERVRMAAEEFDIPEERCFASAEELLSADKLADILILCTQDRQHVPQALTALRKGYDILLEKPVSPSEEECRELLLAAGDTGRKVVVCHVLRYTPFYRILKNLLEDKIIGEIVTVQHIENVQYWHQAHSFVRGNWRREDETSPMILAKCCHDMDLMLWLTGKHCRRVTSFGGLALFRPEMAPEGAAERCLDGCKAKENCPYDAEKIYITDKKRGVAAGYTGWPVDVVTDLPTVESVTKALRTGPYGRCVFACDNDVVDHQVVNMELEDGCTVSLTMTAFTDRGGRDTVFMGTHGEIIANMQENTITVLPFGKEKRIIDVSTIAENFSGHGGGDVRMLEQFVDWVQGGEPGGGITSLEVSIESHLAAFAAEESRLLGGKPVEITAWT